MKGLPSHFGTEADIINCLNEDPAGTKVMLQRLLDSRFGWVRVADLKDGDPGVNDEVHEVRLEPKDPNADLMSVNVPTKKVQYELREDPLSQLFRLGLTTKAVNDYIKECDKRMQ